MVRGDKSAGRPAPSMLTSSSLVKLLPGWEANRDNSSRSGGPGRGTSSGQPSSPGRSYEDVRRLGEEAGPVDVLVNNAGIFPGGPADQLSEADFDATIAINVKAPFLPDPTIAPKMAAKGERIGFRRVEIMVHFCGQPPGWSHVWSLSFGSSGAVGAEMVHDRRREGGGARLAIAPLSPSA